MSRRGWYLFIAEGFIWGLPYLLIRVAVRHVAPGTLVFMRTAPAGMLLTVIAVHRGALAPVLARFGWLLLYSAVELGATWLLLNTAEEKVTSSFSALMMATIPLLSIVFYRFFRNVEPLGRTRLAGMLIGFGGVAALVGLEWHTVSAVSVLELFVTAVGYTLGPMVISQKLADLPGLGVVAGSLMLVAIAYSPYALTHLPSHAVAETWWSLAGLAFICTALAFVIFFEMIKEIGPQRTTVITYVNPAVAVILGVSLLHEHLTAGIVVGFALIITGSIFATSRSTTLTPVVVREGLISPAD